jgi:hypothetical protein
MLLIALLKSEIPFRHLILLASFIRGPFLL